MKKYQTMLTKDYVPDWDVANGIREFVANALDSPYPFEYEISDSEMSLTSIGVQLPPSVLTLGTSGNRLDSDAVGCHGEGILIGIIPILRDGGSVRFFNGDVQWEAAFEYNEDFGKDTLVIIETPLPYSDGNYTVNITADSSDIEEAVSNCLYLQKDLGEVFEGERGRVLKGIQGKLFVGGLFVCSLPTHQFSYDFKAKYLPLNRDRRQVDSWCLSENTSALLDEVFPAKEIARLVDERVKDVQDVSWSLRSRPQEVAEEVYELFKETHGDDAIITYSYDTQKALEARGIKNVVVQYESTYRQLVEQSVEYKKVKAEIEAKADDPVEVDDRSAIDMFKDWYENTGRTRTQFQEFVDYLDKRGVSWDSDAKAEDIIPF